VGHLKDFRHLLGLQILKEACSSASAVVCPTEVVKLDVIRHIPSIESGKLKVIPNFAADPVSWPADQLKAFKEGLGVASRKVILYFGKVKRSKGIEDICRAYSLLPSGDEVALLVAGSPTRTDEFLKYLKFKYPHVIFTGFVENPAIYYQIADLFCIYTSGFDGGETFAISLAESMRYGVPSVCSDNPIFREVTKGNAFFAPAQDPRSLSRVM
jgi:glycosyltransferase involved in cell wall biosynthesis